MAEKGNQISPDKILQVGMGFWASKTLLTAVNLRLFTHLSNGELTGHEIQTKLNLHGRSLYDFLDALVALGFLNRTGIRDNAKYCNSEDSDLFLDENKPSYIGGILAMSNNRLFGFWDNLDEALQTGEPQNETKSGGRPIFEEIYSCPERTREFLKAMAGIQMGGFTAFAKSFDFSEYQSLCDIGGAGAQLSTQVVLHNDHMNCISFDLPPATAVASKNIKEMGLSKKIHTQAGDFFRDTFPKVDIITMGNILHDWGLEDKKKLIRKAYESLSNGGSLVVIENIIDNNRDKNAFGLLMSLNMLIETKEGYDFSQSDFNEWAFEIGFKETSIMHLAGPSSAIIAVK